MTNNMTKTLSKKTGWVSLSVNYKKVIASDKTLSGLLTKLGKQGNPAGYLMKAAQSYSRFVGYGKRSGIVN